MQIDAYQLHRHAWNRKLLNTYWFLVMLQLPFELLYSFTTKRDASDTSGHLIISILTMILILLVLESTNKYYKKLLEFYKENGVAFSLIDSDGKVDRLIPSWLGSGFDIIFPVEVGTWGASPQGLREQFGSGLKMLGGVDKHIIPKGEAAIREHLLSLKPAVQQGGYLPIPDHRIPPECSYVDFQTYLRVYNEVFNS